MAAAGSDALAGSTSVAKAVPETSPREETSGLTAESLTTVPAPAVQAAPAETSQDGTVSAGIPAPADEARPMETSKEDLVESADSAVDSAADAAESRAVTPGANAEVASPVAEVSLGAAPSGEVQEPSRLPSESPAAMAAPAAQALPAETSQDAALASGSPAPADEARPMEISKEDAAESAESAVDSAADAAESRAVTPGANAEGASPVAEVSVQDAAIAPGNPAPADEARPMEISKDDAAESAESAVDSAADAAESRAVTPAANAEAASPVAEVSVRAASSGEMQKPKKPVSAYWLYSQHLREEVTQMLKEQNDGKASFGDIAKQVSARWAALADAEKKEFEDKANADKQRYARELLAYQEACDPVGALKKKFEHLIPKRPASAYALFCQDPAVRQRAEQAVAASGQAATSRLVSAKLAEMWKGAALDERGPFQDAHWKEHGAFQQKQRVWQATPEYAEIQKAEKEQEERRKAAEAAEAARVRSEKSTAKRATKSEAAKGTAEQTPVKRKVGKGTAASSPEATPKAKPLAAEATTPAPAAKKARRSLKGAATVADKGPQIDEKVLAEAAGMGLDAALRNLASRPEVVAAAKSSAEILAALQTSGGLVNAAKRSLIGS